MINFRKMVDYVRSNKAIFDHCILRESLPASVSKDHPQHDLLIKHATDVMHAPEHQKMLRNKFFSLIEKAHVFLFEGGEPTEISIPKLDHEVNLDLPFEVCVFERVLGMGLTSEHRPEIHEVRYCLLVNETAPKEYEIFCLDLIMMQSIKSAEYVMTYSHTSSIANPSAIKLLEVLIQEIGTGKLGREKVKERVKIGSGANKRVHEIRTLIHVVQSLPRVSEGHITGHRNVDWTHRWEVRGHWRELPGRIGKNRQDEYCIDGKTWVRDTIKGPGDMPLVSKTRLVE